MKLLSDLGYIYPTEKSKRKSRYGVYICDCGNEFRARADHVNSRKIVSCGCYNRKIASVSHIKHGMTKHPAFQMWRNMMKRCYGNDNKAIRYKTGKISVCEEWMNPVVFCLWAEQNGMLPGLEIDRINCYEGYSPTNCRIVEGVVNRQNTRLLSTSNTSGYRGVSLHKKSGKWAARIWNNGVSHNLGLYEDKKMAAFEYNRFVVENKTYHPLNII